MTDHERVSFRVLLIKYEALESAHLALADWCINESDKNFHYTQASYWQHLVAVYREKLETDPSIKN